MANIIGEPIDKIIAEQIKVRQKAHGSGVPGNERKPEYHVYLNSKTAWIKLASAIEITEQRLKDEKLNPNFKEKNLAKYAVLFDGVSRLDGTVLKPRGTRTDGVSNIWDRYDGTYNINASTGENNSTGEFGLVPMPGIESVDVQCLNRGSIKKATVKIKCYSPEQFKILDLLYLRIGYTVFLEWGWAPYLDNNGGLVPDYATLIEEKDQGFFDKAYWKSKSYTNFLREIEGYRIGKRGNYDGLLCRVTNFSWTFAQDGSYDIELSLISLGDVIESLKTNITPNYPTFEFIDKAYTQFNDDYQDDSETEDAPPSPVNNWISAYFFVNKLLLLQNRDSKPYWQNRDIVCRIANNPINIFGVFIDANNLPDKVLSTEVQTDNTTNAPDLRKKRDRLLAQGYKEVDAASLSTITTPGKYFHFYDGQTRNKIAGLQTREVYDPSSLIETQKPKDMVYLHWNSGEDDEDMINDQGFYIRFGHLLDIISSFIVPRIEDSAYTPILNINSETSTNKMYLFPYQVSLDPRVCIINSGGENINSKEYYINLQPFKHLSGEERYGWTMNIYLNCAKINDIISSNLDEKNNLDLFSFLESICTEINKALGGVNNLEPVIDETTNTLRIVDGSYTEPQENNYELELYGYNQNNPAQPNTTVSNFVRNFSIKTEITNDFATMATVGSTAGGYVKGTENTMFSKWNKGLIDTFKEKLVPADPKSRTEEGKTPEPQEIYVKEFWWKRYSSFGLTAPFDVEYDYFTSDTPNISPEMCDKNIALVAEFYKYCQSKLQEERDKYSSPTNGFIPISLSITMDGISGIKIYNALNVVTRFLPQNYPDSLKFIIKGVNHKINGNDWETTIETVVIANNEDNGKPVFEYDEIKQKVFDIITSAANELNATSENPESSSPGGTSSTQPKGSGVYSNPPLPDSVKSETGSDLEKFTKEAASEQFAAEGSNNSYCGAWTYKMAERLAKKLTKKSKFPGTGQGGNHAYSNVLRTHLDQLGIYKPESLTPVATGLPPDQARAKIDEITKKADYGDALVYFMTPPPQFSASSNARFHAQLYTGNLYTKLGGTGWSTSNYTNYSTSMVYRTGDPYTIYWFRIKDEYKGKSSKSTQSTPQNNSSSKESARAFNSLTYMISLIWKLKDNYGSKNKPLFEPYKGNFDDDETSAVAKFKVWFNTDKPKTQYDKLNSDDKQAFDSALSSFLSKALDPNNRGNQYLKGVTFESPKNKDVKKILIDFDF